MEDWYKKFKEMNDDELSGWVSSGAQVGSNVSNLAIAELTRRSIEKNSRYTKKLAITISKFNKSSSRYSRTIIVLTWILIILTLIMAIPISSDIYRYFNSPASQESISNGGNKAMEVYFSKFAKLSAGVNINYFKNILGLEPVFINSPSGEKDCKQKNEQKEFIFVNDLFYIQAIVGKDESVIEYAITTKSKDFNPEFNFWNGTKEAKVTLGKTRFLEAVSNPPEKIDYSCGAHNYEYSEEHYFGNPSNYQYFILANNQAGIPSSDTACKLQNSQSSPNPIPPDSKEAQNARRDGLINTFSVTAPFVSMQDLCFNIGPSYNQVRVLDKNN